ncbi:MAG: tRNA (adenosine(37)-N6)-threonylcarbamoyltransferase complex ATPase subunit type 1 TsaE [Patescibacteria group bacterium]|jgi:tRNA threonylcarbamoyladenosine biosynthesis protein TsaE
MKETHKKFVSKSEKQTRMIGEDLGIRLKNGGIIALSGNLGAGKTVFIKGVAKGLGIKSRITSPTFVFWRVYPVAKKQLKHFCHVDLYRLPRPGALQNIGIEEYWERADTVCLIEWAEKAKKLPENKLIYSVKIKIIEKNIREIEVVSL